MTEMAHEGMSVAALMRELSVDAATSVVCRLSRANSTLRLASSSTLLIQGSMTLSLSSSGCKGGSRPLLTAHKVSFMAPRTLLGFFLSAYSVHLFMTGLRSVAAPRIAFLQSETLISASISFWIPNIAVSSFPISNSMC